MAQSIQLKTVNDLLGMKFFIPKYQRGYRWTRKQVKDLLNDIWTFKPEKVEDTDEYSWYCLQPLVVKENKKENRYDVIDGQQRLTTIFIILNCLDDSSELCLEYETRNGSADFLKDIQNKSDIDDTYIDYHFMLEAKETILEWRRERGKQDIPIFVQRLKENCKVIWYPIAENESAYEVFKRLNSGKLSLSNAELIKALLLNKENFRGVEDTIYLRQLEMSGEWDRIEHTLHNDSFWYFINPEPESSKYKATRIDFIFEMALLSRKNDNETFIYNSIDDELAKDGYFIFNCYCEQCTNDGNAYKAIWKEIVSTFRIIDAWFNDRQLYHYVGYLMNQKGKDKILTLRDILVLAKEKSKTDFLAEIKQKCSDSILDNNHERDFESLSYFDVKGRRNSADCAIMHNILLLFNLATIQNQISENARYPFDKHVKEKWSLEHIHAKNEKRENVTPDRVKTITKYLENSGNEVLANLLWPKPRTTDPNEIRRDTIEYEALTKAFEGNIIALDAAKKAIDEIKLKSIDDSWYQTSIRNMALLQGDKNSQFNNSYYPEKKVLLSTYEGNNKQDTTIEFVPICTRNAFFKHYSPNSNNPLCWDKEDGKNMLEAMVKNIAEYVGLNEFGKLEDVSVPSRNYGLKK